MKSKVVKLLIASLLLNKLEAEESPNTVGVTVSSTVANKSLLFGTGSVLSSDPVVQTDILLSFKNGIYLDLWNSRSLKGSWNNGSLGNEIDYGIGWKGILTSNLTLNIGVTYFDEPSAFTFGAEDIVYTHAFLTRDFKHLSVVGGFENYTAMPKSGFHGGNLLSLGICKNFSFCKDRVDLDTSLSGVYDTGTIDSEKGLFLRGNMMLSYKATKHFTLNILSLNYFIRNRSDLMAATGLTVSF